MLKQNKKTILNILSLGMILTLIACGESDHSGKYEGTESVTRNGITESNQATLEITQNQNTINGVYTSSDSSGTLVGNVNKEDQNKIESISLTLTSSENYIPPEVQMQQQYGIGQVPYNQNNLNAPVDIQRNQQAYAYQQYMEQNGVNGINNGRNNGINSQNNLYGIPNTYGVNCSGTYSGSLQGTENRESLTGNLTMNASNQCGNTVRNLNLVKSSQ